MATKQQQVDLEPFVRSKKVEEIAKTVRTFFVFGFSFGIAYFISRMVHDLAGQKTTADIGISFLGTIRVSEGLAWAIAAVCGGIAGKVVRTNRSMAKRFGSRMADLERSIDPGRSSSHLSPTGMPREEDK